MRKIIRRSVVIEALRKEPLAPDKFFHEPGDKTCRVCAVGAVLRHVSFETWAIKHDRALQSLGRVAAGFQYIGFSPNNLIAEGNYLGALSCYFEGMMQKRFLVTDKIRKRLVKFVEKNFPESFYLTIYESDLCLGKRRRLW